MKRLVVLGSTGSVGRQALEIVRAWPDRLQVVGLAAGRNAALLAQQVQEFQPRFVFLAEPEGAPASFPWSCQPLTMEQMAAHPEVDLVLAATAGSAGLAPTLAALRVGKPVALANKEVLVMAGALVVEEARLHQAALLPVDSEHSALWQCLQGEEKACTPVTSLTLTASGGALRDLPLEQLAAVTPQQALRHPTWNMGPKITVDSASLMNKGMEAIEAHWLFQIPYDRIQVVLHRESIVHGLVEFADGSVKAQLSRPDMRLPLQYAFSYPERWESPVEMRLSLTQLGSLTFQATDPERYPCLGLALEAGRCGATYPAVLCGADEAAVELFLAGRIAFLDIPRLVEEALAHHSGLAALSLEAVLAAEAWGRAFVLQQVKA